MMKLSFKQMLGEFKAFAFKGNLIDLAVAVVIGGAFSGVVQALVHDIIMPAVIYAVTGVSEGSKKLTEGIKEGSAKVGLTTRPSTTQSSATTEPATQETTKSAEPPVLTPPPSDPAPASKVASEPKAVNLKWKLGEIDIGHFIGELLNFIIIAFAVFLIVVKLLGSVMKKMSKPQNPSEPTTRECPKCLSLIPIKATKCAHCTSDLLPPTPTPTPDL